MQSTGTPDAPKSVREKKGHQSAKMLSYVAELIYTEQKYIEDMKEFSNMLGALLTNKQKLGLSDSDVLVLTSYQNLVINILNQQVILQKITQSQIIYQKLQGIFDDKGIPEEDRREKIQDVLPILKDRYIRGEYSDIDENVMAQLFNESLGVFQDTDVIAYINSFNPLIANSDAFIGYIKDLSSRCPIDPNIVKKLTGNDSYSIKPTQRLGKYPLLIDAMRGEIPYPDETRRKDIAENEDLKSSEKTRQLRELRSETQEGKLVEDRFSETMALTTVINDKRKSVTVLDLKVSILLERTEQALENWANHPDSKDYESYFSPKLLEIAQLRKQYELAQVRTVEQIEKDAKAKPQTANEMRLQQVLEQKASLEQKYKEQLAVSKMRTVWSKKHKKFKKTSKVNKYKKAITELTEVAASLKSQIQLDDKLKQVEAMEAIAKGLDQLNRPLSKEYGDRWAISTGELDSVNQAVIDIKAELNTQYEEVKLAFKDKVDNAQISAERAFDKEDQQSLRSVLATLISYNSAGKAISDGAKLKEEMSSDIFKILQSFVSLEREYSKITERPRDQNVVNSMLTALHAHSSKEEVGVFYNRWTSSFDKTDSNYQAKLNSNTYFSTALSKIKATADNIATIDGQLIRLNELTNELLKLIGQKGAISYHYNPKTGHVINQLIENLIPPNLDEKQTKAWRKELEREIQSILRTFDNDKSLEVLLEQINDKKAELESNKKELMKDIKEQDKKLEVLSRDILADSKTASFSTPNPTPSEQITQATQMVNLLAQDALFKLDDVIKKIQFERSRHEIVQSKKEGKKNDQLDTQIKELTELYNSLNDKYKNVDLPAREKMYAILKEMEKSPHSHLIQHIIADVKTVKHEYNVQFRAQAEVNDVKRLDVRDTKHLVRYGQGKNHKYDKASIVIASLDHAAKSYVDIIELLKAQQHLLVGKDAEVNSLRLAKYQNALNVIQTIFAQLNYSANLNGGEYQVTKGIVSEIKRALEHGDSKGAHPLPDSTRRLFKELETRSEALTSDNKQRGLHSFFKSVIQAKPKVTTQITPDDVVTFKPKK